MIRRLLTRPLSANETDFCLAFVCLALGAVVGILLGVAFGGKGSF